VVEHGRGHYGQRTDATWAGNNIYKHFLFYVSVSGSDCFFVAYERLRPLHFLEFNNKTFSSSLSLLYLYECTRHVESPFSGISPLEHYVPTPSTFSVRQCVCFGDSASGRAILHQRPYYCSTKPCSPAPKPHMQHHISSIKYSQCTVYSQSIPSRLFIVNNNSSSPCFQSS
jgi:hypothetical protein